VRIKLDENLPGRAAEPLESAGHDVDTAVEERLSGASDDDLRRIASAAGRLVVTLDRGFGDVRAHPPGTHAGVLVLRVDDQSPPSVTREIEYLLEAVSLEDLAGCIAVFRRGDVRVRRPKSPLA
jgi:predicted nuclease of predicted toxin-antitoxin system